MPAGRERTTLEASGRLIVDVTGFVKERRSVQRLPSERIKELVDDRSSDRLRRTKQSLIGCRSCTSRCLERDNSGLSSDKRDAATAGTVEGRRHVRGSGVGDRQSIARGLIADRAASIADSVSLFNPYCRRARRSAHFPDDRRSDKNALADPAKTNAALRQGNDPPGLGAEGREA